VQKQVLSFWEKVTARLSMTDNLTPVSKEKDFFDLVEEARQDYLVALSQFNHVSDPDLVDHAIHAMVAAEKKYTFLLKKARQEGYRLLAKLDPLRERMLNNA
jgi:hypothetical protein